jgi:hypothetical protein
MALGGGSCDGVAGICRFGHFFNGAGAIPDVLEERFPFFGRKTREWQGSAMTLLFYYPTFEYLL